MGLFGMETGFLKLVLGQYDAILAIIGIVVNVYGSIVAEHKLELWPSKK